jgi:hypothetical protein
MVISNKHRIACSWLPDYSCGDFLRDAGPFNLQASGRSSKNTFNQAIRRFSSIRLFAELFCDPLGIGLLPERLPDRHDR